MKDNQGETKDENMGSTEDQRLLKQAKNENKKYQQKIEILRSQLESFVSILNQLDS